jgi:cell shape-determining protein MreC
MERDLPNGGVISPRTKVVTSSLSGTIPGGILVGWLIDSVVEPNGLYRTGKVLPAVDFANIKTLFVLTGVGRLR